MGPALLALTGRVYLDSDCIIYAVERHPIFAALLDPFWLQVQNGLATVVTSELAICETQVLPRRLGNAALLSAFDHFFARPELSLIPISRDLLRETARLRAIHTGLRTPDAIHLATAVESGCVAFITNDRRLNGIVTIPIFVLRDVASIP